MGWDRAEETCIDRSLNFIQVTVEGAAPQGWCRFWEEREGYKLEPQSFFLIPVQREEDIP